MFRTEHYAYRTEETYLKWIKRFIACHGNRHPRDMGSDEVQQFLSFLAVERKVSASSQNQALSAILFLYKKVLGIDLPWMTDIVRAKRNRRMPVVLTVRGDETGKLRSFLALLVLPAVFLIAWVTSFVLLATAEKPVSTGRKVLIGGFFALALAAIARVTIVIGGDEPYEITSQVLGTPQEEMPDLRPGLESFVPDNIMHVSLEPLNRTHEERYEFLVGTDLYVGRGTGAPGPAG